VPEAPAWIAPVLWLWFVLWIQLIDVGVSGELADGYLLASTAFGLGQVLIRWLPVVWFIPIVSVTGRLYHYHPFTL
jgi:hypothetical protein